MGETSNGVPQFATAEYAPGTPSLTCAVCRRPFTGSYYQINGAQACVECAQKVRAQIPVDSHAAFARAIVFGLGGALVGFLLYVLFALATGLVFGLASLAVGFIVGKAMSVGSRGVGGRRYQVAAVALTYLAVSLSAVPIAIHQMRQQHPRQAQAASQPAPTASRQPPREPLNVARAVGVLALLGIASPFLELRDPTQGIIGLIILFVGLRFAWRFTAGRRIEISGPYAPAPAGVI
jgi:hypothetical protein